MAANPETHAGASTTTERRQHHRVREIFEEAVVMIAPFFEHNNDWGHGTLEHLAYRSLRDAYPELSVTEVHVLIVAARRFYAAGGTGSNGKDN